MRVNGRALRYLNIAHFFDHYFLLIFPTAVLAMHIEWSLSYAEALGLATPSFLLFALATLPCGWLGDRYGGVVMMRIFFIGLGLSGIATGLATGPVSMMIGMALIGLFTAIYHPVATAMIVSLTDRPGRELGINGVWGNLGVALAAATTALLTAHLSWRAAFIVPGVLSLVFGLAYLALKNPGGETSVAGNRANQGASSIDPDDQKRVFLVVGVTALFGGLIFACTTVAMPKLFEERLPAMTLQGVGFVTTAVFFLASFTQLFTGTMVDKLGPRPVMLLAAGLQVPLLLLLVLLPGAASVPVAVPLLFAIFGGIPVASWLLGHYVAPAWRSRAYGMQFMLALGVNALIVPLISGLHAGTGSSDMLFLLLALSALFVFMASFLIPGSRKTAVLANA